MAAATKPRNTVRRDGTDFVRPMAAGTTIHGGTLVVLNAAGFAAPGTTALNLIADGRAEESKANPGANGAATVRVRPGVYRFDNSAAADLIAIAEIGDDAFIVDDQTVAKTNGGNTRSRAGRIVDVDAQGVWVAVGIA